MASSAPRKVKKFADSTGASEENAESREYDTETQKILEDIDSCQNDIDVLNEEASEEILKIEQKYNKLRKPHFEKRNEFISKIQSFWFTAFSNHPDLSTILDDSEEECLQHLRKLDVEEFEDIKSGYRITFYFDENPYFENTILTKEFHLESLEDATSESTQIKWKDGYDLTQINSEPRAPKVGRKRHLEQKSFFRWFNDHMDPCSDDIAEIIKDDLWINPLQYFLIPDIVENGGDESEEDEVETEVSQDDGENSKQEEENNTA